MASMDETAATTKRARDAGRNAAVADDDLGEQIARLQKDLKEIAATVTRLADQKVDEARGAAKHEVRNVVRTGQQAVEDIQDEFSQVEKQLKDVIRQKPLTAVAGAIALGFLIALVTR